jgi:Ca2+-binding EF-hand superfamily protein
MRTLTLATLSLTAALGVFAVQAADPAPAKAADDVQEFVFLGESRPVLVRLHIRMNDKPLQAAWDDCMKYLFDYLDVDADGVLSKEEAERAPAVEILLGGLGGGQAFGRRGNQNTGPTMADLDADKDGKVTREELAAYYRSHGFVPFRYQLDAAPANPLGGAAAFLGGPRPEPAVEAVNKAIFEALDTDKSGKLTKEKLSAAAALLLKLDENEDELVSTRELVPDAGGANLGQLAGMFAMGRPGKAATSSASLVPITTPGEVPADLVRRMKDRYAKVDASDEKKVHAKDIGLDEATFRQLDADNNSVLDDQELAAFIKRAPDLEMVVHVGKKETGARIELTKEGQSPLANQLQIKDSQALLDLGRARADIRLNLTERPDQLGGIIRQQLTAQFKQADTNGDGFLDAKEAADSRAFKALFKGLDRKGTGKVSEKDVADYLDHLQELQKRAAASCMTLDLSDQSRGLFDLLDANRDSQLSVRELRQAPKLLAQLDRDGKGYITREDIPRTYRLELHRGPGRNNQDPGRAFVDAYFTPGEQGTGTVAKGRGPVWFQKMDRNHDGDVSRKEFLFGDELFREIDTDGDGLISVEEAEAYDGRHREKK